VFVFLAPLTAVAGPEAVGANHVSGSGMMRVPVEVVTHESGEHRWVMIDVAAESIPEPESVVLVLLAGLLLWSRRRN